MLLNLLIPLTMLFPARVDLAATLEHFDARAAELPQTLEAPRLAELNALAEWIAEQPADSPVELIFICTHNSRRSHMGQIWAQAAAYHHGLDHIRTYSGGTEATAFNPRAVAALRGLGVGLSTEAPDAANPLYRVELQPDHAPSTATSKVYSDAMNPQSGFAAVMTCSDADEACPLVFGAAARFALPYIDPKVADGTDEEAATYRERAEQIGVEMSYVMGRAAALRTR